MSSAGAAAGPRSEQAVAGAAGGAKAAGASGAPASASSAQTVQTATGGPKATAGTPAPVPSADVPPASADSGPDSMPMAAAGGGGSAAPSGMAAGAGGSTEAAGAGGSVAAAGSGGAVSAPAREDQGKGEGSDVVTIGDSWMSNTLGTGNAIEGALQRLTMQRYRNYGVQGVMLMSASAFGAAVPSQYESAKRIDSNIKTVIMTGGGNDIIQNPAIQASCNEGGQECVDLLNRISDTLNELWTEMAADGVQDVIYIRYSRDAGSTSDEVRGMQKPIEICSSGKIRCHSIDSTEAVMADLPDGIHPSRAANDRLAKVIWDLMEKEGVRR